MVKELDISHCIIVADAVNCQKRRRKQLSAGEEILFSVLVMGLLLETCLPDSSTAGSTPENDDGAATREAADITNLRHQLQGSLLALAVHGSNGFVLRELLGKPIHLCAHDSESGLGGGKAFGGGSNEQLCIVVP